MTKNVFISYAREDQHYVLQLAHTLTEKGLQIWIDIDPSVIPPGASWQKRISDGIADCDALLAIQSESSLTRSYQCKGEWAHAYDLKKPIFPILIDADTSPHRSLTAMNAIHIPNPADSDDEKLNAIVESINTGEEIPKQYVTQSLFNRAKPQVFPGFYNQDKGSYGTLFDEASVIRTSSSSGYNFLTNYRTHFEDFAGRGGCLDIVLARPTENSFRHMAYWSAWRERDDIAYAYKRIRQHMLDNLTTVDDFLRDESWVRLRMVDRFMPTPITLLDPDATHGKILVGIYAFGQSAAIGRSIKKTTMRPGTMLTRYDSLGLYDHFYQIFDNIWADSSVVTADEIIALIEATPVEYDLSKPQWA